MEKELLRIFSRTIDAHFPAEAGLTREEYVRGFQEILHRELPDAPVLEVKRGNLATYLKLSILALSMIKQQQGYGASERAIGERIYRTAEAYFALSPLRKWVQRALFFSRFNLQQIKKRQDATRRTEHGINGFKLSYVEGATRSELGVDYLACGICEYFKRKGLFDYVKYLCLVDYAIMKNLGVAFRRTTTLGNHGPKCDFRFSKTGPIVDGWPPDALQEFGQ